MAAILISWRKNAMSFPGSFRIALLTQIGRSLLLKIFVVHNWKDFRKPGIPLSLKRQSDLILLETVT